MKRQDIIFTMAALLLVTLLRTNFNYLKSIYNKFQTRNKFENVASKMAPILSPPQIFNPFEHVSISWYPVESVTLSYYAAAC